MQRMWRLGSDTTARRAGEARTRAILDSALDGVVAIDHLGVILEFNAAAQRMFGYGREEAIGRPIAELIIPASLREAHVEGLRHYLASGEGPVLDTRIEVPALRSDGSEFPIELSIVRVEASDPPVFIGYARDISERVKREAAALESAAIIGSSLDAIVGRTPEGIVTSWNAAAESLFGYAAEEIIGRSITILAPVERSGELDAVNERLQHGETVRQFETVRLHKDGTRIEVATTVSPITNAAGEIVAASAISRDISEHKRAEAKVRQSEERYRDLFENASDPLATVDLDGYLTEVNAAFVTALGYTEQELIGSSFDRYLDQESIELAVAHRERKMSGLEAISNYEQTFVDKGGRQVVFEVSTRLISEGGRPGGVQGTCRDVTGRKEAESKLRQLAELNHQQATHDHLTGLPNRLHLQERLELALAGGEGFALVVVDLDRFKEINDSLGHHSGDLLLREVAGRLRQAVRAPDAVARLGGDEFGILLHSLSEAEPRLSRRISELKTTLERPVFVQGIPVAVEASIGIAFHPQHGESAELLLQHADVAMYVAKREHRGHATYDAREDSNDPSRVGLLDELRRGIDNRELTLVYQPTIDLRTGNVTRVEALARWQHPTRGLLLPGQFIPIAEQTALIKPLTRYVLEHAVQQCKQWERDGHPLSLAVNLSARNLSEPDLVDDIVRILDKWKLAPERLLLEITESAILSHPARTEGVLRTLHELGIELAIDDFGTGYSSLAYLANLPLNQVKIDRSFITGILNSERDAAIVEAIIRLSNILQLQVVAEGVENVATLNKLRGLNCDLVQGYHLGKPLPADELIHWIIQREQPMNKAA